MRIGDSARDGGFGFGLGHPTTGRSPRAPRPAEPGEDEPSPFARVLRGLGKEVDRGERLTRRAIEGGGKELSSGDLLALQAGVYRYSEAVDLSAKLIDRATNGVKTVLQGQ
jgi:hypothetical protein